MICIKNLKSEQCEHPHDEMRAPREKMRRVLSQKSMKSPEEDVLESRDRGHAPKFWS